MSKPVRVLVVDGSALMRKLISQILEKNGSITVVGTAMDGAFGLRKIEELKPHVVTLDLEIPRMDDDGVEAIRAVKDAGGWTLAQSSHSCVVDSMPRSAIERGYIPRVLEPDALSDFRYTQCHRTDRVSQ